MNRAADPAATGRLSAGRQALLVALLSLNFGIVFFDRNATNFLMPFVQPELGLTNTQVGNIASALSFSWALAAFGVGRLSDTMGNRKLLLVCSTLAFSACSFLTGLAQSFALLLGARLLMGLAEGGVMPISHAMVASEVSPERRGLAQGIAQNFGSNLLGSFVAPVLLVAFAQQFGWRNAFFIAGIPGIISGLAIWFLIDEPKAPSPAPAATRESPLAVLRDRNVVLCCLMAIVLVSYLVICWAFMPLYLTKVRGLEPQTMGWLMGVLGISATIGSFLVAGLSDFAGRRPVMVLMPIVSVILPIGAMYWQGSAWGLGVIFFFGWALNGVFPLFMATVPSESVPPGQVATALGLSMGTGEILGGVLAPSLAGMAADAHGLTAPLWIMTALTLIGALLALGLRETAPRALARRAAKATV
jgi:ACS family hexuronate transporter-like MFS transporter